MLLKKPILIVLVVIIYITFAKVIASKYVADVLYTKSEKSLDEGRKIEAINAIDTAIKLNPNEPNYFKQRAKIYIASTLNSDEKNIANLKALAINDLTKALDLNPNNMATIRNGAPLYFFLANKDLSLPSTENNIDPEYIELSQEYFKQMQNYYSEDVGVQILAAKYQKRLGLDADYRESLERIKYLRPDLLEWQEDLIQ